MQYTMVALKHDYDLYPKKQEYRVLARTNVDSSVKTSDAGGVLEGFEPVSVNALFL